MQFQVMLPSSNNFTYTQLNNFTYTQLNNFKNCYETLTIQFRKMSFVCLQLNDLSIASLN